MERWVLLVSAIFSITTSQGKPEIESSQGKPEMEFPAPARVITVSTLFPCEVSNSNIRFILCIPHTGIPKLPNQPELWRNVQLVLQSKMCKVVFNNSQQSTFSASVPNDFKSVSFIVTSRKPFVVQEDILIKIEQKCYQQTLLPFILSDPIPNHVQQLSRHSPQTTFSHPLIPVVSRTPPPPTPYQSTHKQTKYSCNISESCFKTHSKLKEHKTAQHNPQVYSCDHCGHKAASLGNLHCPAHCSNCRPQEVKSTSSLITRVPVWYLYLLIC